MSRRLITFDELSPDHIKVINEHLSGLKSVIQLCADRAMDDYDDLIGLLAYMVSRTYGYDKGEIIASIDEQFEYND